MIYRVIFDGISIFDTPKELTLLNPKVETELNSAGSFEFTMPKIHSYYDIPKLLTQDVYVYEEDELIFFGRPISINLNWRNDKPVYCEGPLAFFNDSIQRPKEVFDYSVHTFFRDLITSHNDQVPLNRRFTVGRITVADKLVYRKTDYESTKNCLDRMCLEAEGGYLFFRREDDVTYIDWLDEMPYNSNQPVQFGLNLLDLAQYMDGSDIITAVIPLGEEDETTGERLTIKSVNGALDYIDSDAVSTYGRILAAVEFNGITDASKLLELGKQWLTDQQFDRLSIECDAAELYYLNGDYTPFRVGQNIQVSSTPHLINKTFPLVKISVDLNSAKKQISIGTMPRKTLTEIYENSY